MISRILSLSLLSLLVGAPSFAEQTPKPIKTEVHTHRRVGDQQVHEFRTPDGGRVVSSTTIGGRHHGSSTTVEYNRDNSIRREKSVTEYRTNTGQIHRTVEVSRDRGQVRTVDSQRHGDRTVINTYKGDVYRHLPQRSAPPRR